jgi:hypothetical protein
MNIFIDVKNNQVTVNGKTVEFDVSTLAGLYEAINHSDVGTHVRTVNGEVITEGIVIPELQEIISSAEQIINANEVQQQIIAAAPKFDHIKYTHGQFNVYRVFAEQAGSITFSGDKIDIDRNNSRRVSVVTMGSRKYEPIDGRFPAVTLNVGDYNLDLPNMQSSDRYKITAMEPNTEYHCISRVDLEPYQYERLSLNSGQKITLLAGRSLFIGGGKVSGSYAPTVIYKTFETRVLDVEADMFGLIFW